MDLRFDASDFDALARDLTAAAAGDLLGQVEKVVSKGALEVKDGMRYDMLSSQSFNAVADAISYDVDRFAEHTRAEIGPVSAGQQVGDLAHIAYFGGSDGKGRAQGGGTVRDPEYWLDWQGPIIEKHVSAILDDLL